MFFRSAREKQTTIPCPVCAKALYSTIGSDKPRRASEAISAQIASEGECQAGATGKAAKPFALVSKANFTQMDSRDRLTERHLLMIKRTCHEAYMYCEHCQKAFDLKDFIPQMDAAMEEFLENLYANRI